MSELRTRDGKIVKGPGTWELEQMKHMKDMIAPEKPKQSKKGRQPFDTKKYPMLFITRLYDDNPDRAYWFVKPVLNGIKQSSKTFLDKKCGGKEKGLKLALEFRDDFIKQHKEK